LLASFETELILLEARPGDLSKRRRCVERAQAVLIGEAGGQTGRDQIVEASSANAAARRSLGATSIASS
jgi:hypothetical protein